jgi:hypothetical protein
MAQEPSVSWEKNTGTDESRVELFHSALVYNLPTTQTLKRGEFEYEIAHRFIPEVDQKGAYFGIDGPAHIRMALSYALTDRGVITFGRTNNQDNIDLRAKYSFLDLPHTVFPVGIGIQAGGAFTTQEVVAGRDKWNGRNFQYYGQLIINTLIAKKIGVGVVPSYLYNSHVACKDVEYSFTTGAYLQWYIIPMWSVLAEGNMTVTGYRGKYNSFAFGLELETGGHFFKIMIGNSASQNPSQYLAGSDLKPGGWRLGFNITRVLKF